MSKLKCWVVYRVEPLTHKQIIRCTRGTCNHRPLFACSWLWLAGLVAWILRADYVYESLDEHMEVESVDDDGFNTRYATDSYRDTTTQLVRKDV